VAWVAGYIPRWFTRPQTVTHPSTNRARCRVTSLITTKALTTTPRYHQTLSLAVIVNLDIWSRVDWVFSWFYLWCRTFVQYYYSHIWMYNTYTIVQEANNSTFYVAHECPSLLFRTVTHMCVAMGKRTVLIWQQNWRIDSDGDFSSGGKYVWWLCLIYFTLKTKHSLVDTVTRSRRQIIAIDRCFEVIVRQLWLQKFIIVLLIYPWCDSSGYMLHLMFVMVLVLLMTLLCIALSRSMLY